MFFINTIWKSVFIKICDGYRPKLSHQIEKLIKIVINNDGSENKWENKHLIE